MFSRNVFSARDVPVNSGFSDNNVWSDSQPYSQTMHSSQNSQMSSMETFSQQKGAIQPNLDQYQQSQSQTSEEEPPNYYYKYVSKPPLFQTSSKNKLARSVQAFIEEGKQNMSLKEERDMLQTFINLLKDYTKEVDSSFKNFKTDMETSLKAIKQNMEDGSQRIDDKVMSS